MKLIWLCIKFYFEILKILLKTHLEKHKCFLFSIFKNLSSIFEFLRFLKFAVICFKLCVKSCRTHILKYKQEITWEINRKLKLFTNISNKNGGRYYKKIFIWKKENLYLLLTFHYLIYFLIWYPNCIVLGIFVDLLLQTFNI